jgi:murein DD-endopeptidase MepM/ murein hydrolase activator NlpD
VVLTAVVVVAPRYWELKTESLPLPPMSVPTLPKIEIVEGTIQRPTLVATLVDLDVPANIAHEIAGLIQPVFDVRKIRLGNLFRLEKDTDGAPRFFEYKIDDERVLKVERDADSYAAKVETLEFETRQSVISAEITNSLFEALDGYPKGESLAADLAQVFASEVDFSSDIQSGDQLRLLVEEQYYRGDFVKYGKIRAAQLINAGKTYRAFRFRDSYYDDHGNAMKRSLLRSPLEFTRISSGFTSRRMHPILGTNTPHLAVDYAAPTGTPVIAVANGIVTFAGWNNGGYGNLVEIKHNNGLTTGYAHLSQIAPGLHTGQAVRQGERVGAVGQTGLATGPHLHFSMARGGKPINPLSMKSEPATPIEGALKPVFLSDIAALQDALQ